MQESWQLLIGKVGPLEVLKSRLFDLTYGRPVTDPWLSIGPPQGQQSADTA